MFIFPRLSILIENQPLSVDQNGKDTRVGVCAQRRDGSVSSPNMRIPIGGGQKTSRAASACQGLLRSLRIHRHALARCRCAISHFLASVFDRHDSQNTRM